MTDPLSPTPRAGFDPDVCAICVDVECDGVACVAALDSNDPEDHPMIEQVQTWVRVGRTSSTVIADLCANVDRLRAERDALLNPPGHCAGPSWAAHEVTEVYEGDTCPSCGTVML